MNISVLSRNIGIALVFNAVFMFIGVITSIIYDFDSAFSPLLLSAVITKTKGKITLIKERRHKKNNEKEGFFNIGVYWVV